MMESDPWPTELKVDKDRGVLAVTFDDGVSFALPAELLIGDEPKRRGARP